MTIEEVIKILEKMQNIKAEEGLFGRQRPSRETVDYAKNEGWEIANGATKFCFIIPNADFVIKFSVNSEECEKEVRAYESAKKYRVEKVLLETKFIYENSNGIRFYSQPKIDKTLSELMDNTQKMRQFEKIGKTVDYDLSNKVLKKMYAPISDTWIRAVISLYGKKFCKSLQKWSKENRVNDLHYENISFIKNRPIIFDYAGYLNF